MRITLRGGDMDPNLTWSEAYRLWQKDRRRVGRSPSYISAVRESVSLFCDTVGDIVVAKTTRRDLLRFERILTHVDDLPSARKRLRYLSQLGQWLKDRQYKDSPYSFLDAPPEKPEDKKGKSWKADKYLSALDDCLRLPTEFAIANGLHNREVCSVLDDEITDESIIVYKKFDEPREIVLTPALKRLIARARAYKVKTESTSAYLFVRENGQPHNRYSLLRGCQAAWRKAKLPHMTVRELVNRQHALIAGKTKSSSGSSRTSSHKSEREISCRKQYIMCPHCGKRVGLRHPRQPTL